MNLNIKSHMQQTTQKMIFTALLSMGLALGSEGPESREVSKSLASSKSASIAKPNIKTKTNPKTNLKTYANANAKAKLKSSAGPMQVDEPSVKVGPKSKAKVAKVKRVPARGLTADQKNAFRVRKDKMHAMMNLITEKRRALQTAKPEARAALARELHSMILEREPSVGSITAQTRISNAGNKIVIAPGVTPEVEAIKATAE